MPEVIPIAFTPHHTVTATVYQAIAQDQAGITLILAHGAGADQTSEFMVYFASGLAQRGIDAVTFNFYYTEYGRHIPDPNDRLEACYRAVIQTIVDSPKLSFNRLAIGGKSMGGRIASQIAAQGTCDLLGLVFLGYPLHPPGKPDHLRSKHLTYVKAPMLFVQGSRDAFGTPKELRPIINALTVRADLFVVEGGDHSFKVPKKAPVGQREVFAIVLDYIARWLRRTTAAV